MAKVETNPRVLHRFAGWVDFPEQVPDIFDPKPCEDSRFCVSFFGFGVMINMFGLRNLFFFGEKIFVFFSKQISEF